MAEKKSEKPPATPKRKVAAKLFDDVKRPEEIPATPTSKPVIVGHTNIIKDPMVAPVNSFEQPLASESETATEAIIEKPKRELKIQPLSKSEIEDTKPEEAATEEKPTNDEEVTDSSSKAELKVPDLNQASDQPVEDTAEQTSTETTEPDPEQEQESIATPVEDMPEPTTSTAAVDAIVDNINTKKERDEEAEKQQLIDNEINDLINSKQFNVKLRSAPNKRKARALVILLILAALGGAGWYFGVGPGQTVWLKDTTQKPASSTTSNQTTAETPQNSTSQAPTTLAYANSDIKTTFNYPTDWQVETIKDTENPLFNVITLISKEEQIDSITNNAPASKVEAFMRVRIIVENTVAPNQHSTNLTDLITCVSEDVIAGNTNLKLLFTSVAGESPNVSKISLSPDVCLPEANLFSANDQVQFTTKKNTYSISAEYVLSKAYLNKNGISEDSAVAQAQASGITTTKKALKSANSYKQFIDLIKTFKEL